MEIEMKTSALRYLLVAVVGFGVGTGTLPNAQAQSGSGTNLSLGAGADGSSKASGTSYGNIIDGDIGSWWSPGGSTGRVSVKWGSATTVASAIIREPAGFEGRIGSWRLVNNNTGDVLATGSGAGTIDFAPVSLTKINFEITGANGTPAVAEFETYGESAPPPPPPPGSVSLSATASGTSANLSWTVEGITVSGQQVYRDSDPDAAGRMRIANGVTGNSYTDSGLSDGTWYYWIKLTDSNGDTHNSNAAQVVIQTGSGGGGEETACQALVNDPGINWRESPVLQTDQQIVACLADSLGAPVGFGANAIGGYNPGGDSQLVVITKNGAVTPEQQTLDAIGSTDYRWIVFDKDDFAAPSEVAMYRNGCSDSNVRSALDNATVAECRDHRLWCTNHGVSASACEDAFFNDRLNDSSLGAVKIPMIDSNTTLDGRGSNVTFLFSGFRLGGDSSGAPTYTTGNVIITNNRFAGVGHVEDHNLDPDMIRSTGASHDIWIHQNTFENTGDSAYDVKVGAYDITVSFNKLLNVKRASLHGSSDSRTINEQITTTIHDNLYVTTDAHYGESAYNGLRRVPLLRRGQSHMFNNVFYGYRKDLLSVRVGGRIAFEDNMFLNNVDNSKGDDMEYWLATLIRDYTGGSIDVSGSHVWYADGNCQLQGAPGDLTLSYGNTPDMFAGYDPLSKDLINANRLQAGSNLAKYVFATAGKGGMAPYVSPETAGIAAIIAAAPGSCQ
jgi:pectate lyase